MTVVFVISYFIGYRINITPSLPRGIYKIDKSIKLAKDNLVLFCLSEKDAKYAKMKEYLTFGVSCPSFSIPLLKYVVADAGDRIFIDDNLIVLALFGSF